MYSCQHCLLLWRVHTLSCADLKTKRQHTLGPMPALLASSTCLQPLKRASMTRVLVTSFSLKKRFTSPCAMCPYAVTQCLLESRYTAVMWLTCITMQPLFATTANPVYTNAITTWVIFVCSACHALCFIRTLRCAVDLACCLALHDDDDTDLYTVPCLKS